jgi:uncharacterized protein YuzE
MAPTFWCAQPSSTAKQGSLKFATDQDADAVYARVAPDGTPTAKANEVAPNVNLDLEERGNLVGFEVRRVRLRERRNAGHKHAAEQHFRLYGALLIATTT